MLSSKITTLQHIANYRSCQIMSTLLLSSATKEHSALLLMLIGATVNTSLLQPMAQTKHIAQIIVSVPLIENSLNDQLIVIEKFPFPALSIDFDIADFIKHLCSSDFTMNPDTLLFEHSSALVSYVTKFFDKYGSPPVPSILYPDTTRYALPGGIDKTGLAAYSADETDVMTQFIRR